MFNLLLIVFFILGYLAIIFEHRIRVNKAASAILMGVLCWTLNFMRSFPNEQSVMQSMNNHLGEISQVLFFLLGSMTIVELIDSHHGFKAIPNFIRTRNKVSLLWIFSFITFFLSSVLDNVTTTIIMVTLSRRFLEDKEDRMIFASLIILAANAGGAWSPIGDVTTTMLWIHKCISASMVIKKVFIPSLFSLIVPLIFFSFYVRGKISHVPHIQPVEKIIGEKRVLGLGIGSLILVPVLHSTTGMPPYQALMLGMSVMWIFTDLLHKERHHLRIPYMINKIDIPSILFLLGVLMAVSALDAASLLSKAAVWLDTHVGNLNFTVIFMGLVSAVVDNVPLTAVLMGMYDHAQYPMDSKLWEMTAYCVGTGGSILIIGSAAGVVAMGMEKIKFGWYLQRISIPALLGYLAGVIILYFQP